MKALLISIFTIMGMAASAEVIDYTRAIQDKITCQISFVHNNNEPKIFPYSLSIGKGTYHLLDLMTSQSLTEMGSSFRFEFIKDGRKQELKFLLNAMEYDRTKIQSYFIQIAVFDVETQEQKESSIKISSGLVSYPIFLDYSEGHRVYLTCTRN